MVVLGIKNSYEGYNEATMNLVNIIPSNQVKVHECINCKLGREKSTCMVLTIFSQNQENCIE